MDTINHNGEPSQAGRATGFTLIEMMTVLAIAAFIIGLSIAAFRDFGRGAGVKGSMLHCKSGINLARQYAITHRKITTFHFGNRTDEVRGFYYITIPTNQLVGMTNYLSNGIVFSTGTDFYTNPITFKFDGSSMGTIPRKIGIEEWGMGTNGLSGTLQLNPLTGRVRSTISSE